MTPRVAPPAPMINTAEFSKFQFNALMASTKPCPSVLSPCKTPFSIHSVLTALAILARSVSSLHKAKACSLKGTVTFMPTPFSAKNAFTLASKPSKGARRFA